MTEDSLETDQEGGVLKGLIAAVSDPKVWLMALSLTGLVISLSFNQYGRSRPFSGLTSELNLTVF